MDAPLATASALGAAVLFASGTALQYKAARPLPSTGVAGNRVITDTVRTVLGSGRWLAGTGVLAAGLGMHALALHEAPLTLVQPLLILGVLFALPASRYVGGPPVGAADLRWAVLLVAGIAGFLVTSTPASQPAKDIDGGPALSAFAISAVGVAVCLGLARRRQGPLAATAVGAAAGIAFGGSAALIKVCTNVASGGPFALLASWQLYALVLVGGTGLLLSQLSYRAGPMTASLPAINTLNPLVSVLIGWAVFDERFRTGTAAVGIEALCLLVAITATIALSRRAAHDPARTDMGPAPGAERVAPLPCASDDDC